MDVLKYIFIIVGGYLLGSVSISIILSRMLGTDVRKKGSGNAGATNMARTFGLLAGFATLAGDFLKAVIVMYAGYRLCGDWGLMAGGMACTTGHCFPIFYGFRGGKGLARFGLRGRGRRGPLLRLRRAAAAAAAGDLRRRARGLPAPLQPQAPVRGHRARFQGRGHKIVSDRIESPGKQAFPGLFFPCKAGGLMVSSSRNMFFEKENGT